MNPLQTKQTIVAALSGFATATLAPAATSLFESLGYRSQQRLALTPNTPETFLATFGQIRILRKAVPWMEENGIPKASIDQFLVDNPRRLFTRPAA